VRCEQGCKRKAIICKRPIFLTLIHDSSGYWENTSPGRGNVLGYCQGSCTPSVGGGLHPPCQGWSNPPYAAGYTNLCSSRVLIGSGGDTQTLTGIVSPGTVAGEGIQIAYITTGVQKALISSSDISGWYPRYPAVRSGRGCFQRFFKFFTLWPLSNDVQLIMGYIQQILFNFLPKSVRYLIEIWSTFSYHENEYIFVWYTSNIQLISLISV